MDYNIMPKNAKQFICEKCDFICYKQSNYNQHLLTLKHKKDDADDVLDDDKMPNPAEPYFCDCGKEYKHRQGLWKHKKFCSTSNTNKELNNNQISTDLIMNVLQQNKELQDLLIEQHKQNNDLQNKVLELCKNGTHNVTHINSHNKSFNLNFFLNETCKDAMNIMDFVDSIKLQLCDLEKVGKIGFVEGLSNIIVKNLNSLDETKRPVHCTDAKREIMYIKDENKWEKDNDEKKKLRKAIKHIAHKNSMMLNEFKTKHPDCLKSESKYSEHYNTLTFEAMGGKGDDDLVKEAKIIKNIAKEVVIDKNNE